MVSPQQQFWFDMYGFALAMGFILSLIIVIGIICSDWPHKLMSHHMYMRKMKMHNRMIKSGLDSDYVKALEEKLKRES